MFSFFKPKAKAGSQITLKIDGMHCSSCSLNIDGSLEDCPGVLEAKTSFAQSITKVAFDDQQITPSQIIKIIKQTGYQAKLV